MESPPRVLPPAPCPPGGEPRTRRHRRGIGSVLAFVLVLLGIAVTYVVISGIVGSSSRTSLRHVIGRQRCREVARWILRESMRSAEGKRAILDGMISTLGDRGVFEGRPRPSIPILADPVRTSWMTYLLEVAHPAAGHLGFGAAAADPADPRRRLVEGTDTLWITPGPANTFVFDGGDDIEVSFDGIRDAYPEDGPGPDVSVSPVRIRPTLYVLGSRGSGPGAAPAGGRGGAGCGYARGVVTVELDLGTGSQQTTLLGEYRFDPILDPGSGVWDVMVDPRPTHLEVLDESR